MATGPAATATVTAMTTGPAATTTATAAVTRRQA